MFRRLSCIRVFLAFLLTGVAAFAQTDFSAEIANLSHPNNPFTTKIHAHKDKLRFESLDKQGRANSIMIVDLGTRTSVVLMPQQHMYVQQSSPQIPGQGVTFFRPADVENACAEWKRILHDKLEKCNKVGHEAIHERDAVKYEGTSSSEGGDDDEGKKEQTGKETTTLWLDNKLHFPVKWQGPVGTGELRNIQEGPEAADLFEIPAGYVKRNSSNAGPQETPQK